MLEEVQKQLECNSLLIENSVMLSDERIPFRSNLANLIAMHFRF